MISPFHVIMQFAEGFGLDGHFVLRLLNGRIFVSLPAVVRSRKGICRALFKRVSVKQFDPGKLLASLRKVACEARLRIAFELLKRSRRLVPSVQLILVRERRSQYALCDDILIVYPDFHLLRLQVEPRTGQYRVRFRQVGGGAPVGWAPRVLDAEMQPAVSQLPYVLFTALWNLLTQAAASGMYGSSPPGVTMTIDLYRVRFMRTFSFAPDFAMQLDAWFGHPKVSIVDKHGTSFSKPEVAEMDCVPTRSAWKLTKTVLVATKRYIFLAQAQKYLTDFNIGSFVTGGDLHINLPFCSVCLLKCDHLGWQLVGVPAGAGLPVEPEPINKIGGRYSSRCALVVAHLVLWYHLWRATNFHVYNLVQTSTTFQTDDGQSLFITI
jgi:hypothetical protein